MVRIDWQFGFVFRASERFFVSRNWQSTPNMPAACSIVSALAGFSIASPTNVTFRLVFSESGLSIERGVVYRQNAARMLHGRGCARFVQIACLCSAVKHDDPTRVTRLPRA